MKIDKKFAVLLVTLVVLELIIAPVLYKCLRGEKGFLCGCCSGKSPKLSK